MLYVRRLWHRVGMDLPTLATLAATVLGEDMTMTLGFGVLATGGIVTWAETRFHVSALRETVKAQEAKIGALEQRQASAEVREGRLVERFEALVTRLDRMEGKLDQILDQQRHPASRHTA